MKNWLTKHLSDINESYFLHMKHALFFGFSMLVGGLACIIHGIFPFLFQKTASNILLRLMYQFVNRNHKIEDRVINFAALVSKKHKEQIRQTF